MIKSTTYILRSLRRIRICEGIVTRMISMVILLLVSMGFAKELEGASENRALRIYELGAEYAKDGETINFCGFFPGMSQHDAQYMASFYGLDGNDCYVAATSEKAVTGIIITMKALVRILRRADQKCQTFDDVLQSVANVVGDLNVFSRTDKWGERTSRAEREVIGVATLNLYQEGMHISFKDKSMSSKKPWETSEAKSERVKASASVIPNLLRNMMDVPVKDSGMKPFKLGKYEVTAREWMYVMKKYPGYYMPFQVGARNAGDCPVGSVSWNDCQEFLKKLNSLPEIKKSGFVFRLPTEWEWEYACRAGAEDGVCRSSEGMTITTEDLGEIAWIDGACRKLRPVGLKESNAFGLFDMIGNVAEWTQSVGDDSEDQYVYLGGDISSDGKDETKVSKLWRGQNSPKYDSINRGLRLCASKDGVNVRPRKHFSGESKLGDYTWAYHVDEGIARITGVSPKAGDIKIPATIGEGNYPVKILGKEFGVYRSSGGSNGATLNSITIPDSITNIEGGAFSNCRGLKSVIIGDGITSIRGGTFEEMRDLTEVKIGKSVTNIGCRAFYNCRNLVNVTMGDSVTEVGQMAFASCLKLKTLRLSKSLKFIGESTFRHCRNLNSVRIPDSVLGIGDGAFSGCEELTNVKIGKSVKTIGDGSFYGCENLASVMIPDSVTSIGNQAFHGCFKLSDITIGSSVRTIGEYAFWRSNLKRVTLPNSVVSIGAAAFLDNPELEEVIMGKGIKDIGASAFHGCGKLVKVRMPDSVTEIGALAFRGCRNLKDVKAPKRFLPLNVE